MNSYAVTLEALPLQEQESVFGIVKRRRAELIATVKQVWKELAAGKSKPASAASSMRQIKP